MAKKGPPCAASKAGVTKKRGVVKPPTARTPSASLPPLTPAEALHERLEARSLQRMWDEGRIPATLKGLS
jgi:hypothetical protein